MKFLLLRNIIASTRRARSVYDESLGALTLIVVGVVPLIGRHVVAAVVQQVVSNGCRCRIGDGRRLMLLFDVTIAFVFFLETIDARLIHVPFAAVAAFCKRANERECERRTRAGVYRTISFHSCRERWQRHHPSRSRIRAGPLLRCRDRSAFRALSYDDGGCCSSCDRGWI